MRENWATPNICRIFTSNFKLNVMKNVMLISALLASLVIYSQEPVKLLAGLNTGMSKQEVKNELKSNKSIYKDDITLGKFRYAYRSKVNGYKNGKLESIGLFRGERLTQQVKPAFRDLVSFLTSNGYAAENGISVNSSDNYFEYSDNGRWVLVNENKTKSIIIVTMSNMYVEDLISQRVWITKYEEKSPQGAPILD